MIPLFRRWRARREESRQLSALTSEVEQNLETFYVIRQLNRLRPFAMAAWSGLPENHPCRSGDSPLRHYAQALDAYHEALRDAQDFEAWYSADIERQTRDQACILHDKKETAWARFNGLNAVMQSALDDLRAVCPGGKAGAKINPT